MATACQLGQQPSKPVRIGDAVALLVALLASGIELSRAKSGSDYVVCEFEM